MFMAQIINKTADGQDGSMQNRLRAQCDSDGLGQPAALAHSDPALHFHCLQLTRRHISMSWLTYSDRYYCISCDLNRISQSHSIKYKF